MQNNKFTRRFTKILTSTGIVRRIDDLGRVVIPIEIRRKCNIKEDDNMEIFVDENSEFIGVRVYKLNDE